MLNVLLDLFACLFVFSCLKNGAFKCEGMQKKEHFGLCSLGK